MSWDSQQESKASFFCLKWELKNNMASNKPLNRLYALILSNKYVQTNKFCKIWLSRVPNRNMMSSWNVDVPRTHSKIVNLNPTQHNSTLCKEYFMHMMSFWKQKWLPVMCLPAVLFYSASLLSLQQNIPLIIKNNKFWCPKTSTVGHSWGKKPTATIQAPSKHLLRR